MAAISAEMKISISAHALPGIIIITVRGKMETILELLPASMQLPPTMTKLLTSAPAHAYSSVQIPGKPYPRNRPRPDPP